MILSFYSTTSLCCALLLVGLLFHSLVSRGRGTAAHRSYIRLVAWGVIYCIMDSIWGAVSITRHTQLLFLCSSMDLFFIVVSVYFWIDYITSALGENEQVTNMLKYMSSMLIRMQIILLIMNYYQPIIFEVKDGIYYTGQFRQLGFLLQYIALVEREEQVEKQYAMLNAISEVFLYIQMIDFSNGEAIKYQNDQVIRSSFAGRNHSLESRELADQLVISQKDEYLEFCDLSTLQERMEHQQILSKEFLNERTGWHRIQYIKPKMKGSLNAKKIMCTVQNIENEKRREELVAFIKVGHRHLEKIKEDLTEKAAYWSRQNNKSLSLSCGYVRQEEFPSKSIRKLVVVADRRMYVDKESYYTNKAKRR